MLITLGGRHFRELSPTVPIKKGELVSCSHPQFPNSNRTGAENASLFGGGGNFVMLFPASRTDSSTTVFPEPSTIVNWVTLPSDSTFSLTVTCRVFPIAISPVG